MAERPSVILAAGMAGLIRSKAGEGGSASSSEVIHAAIRAWPEREPLRR